MRVWLELTQEEGERLFDTVKNFVVDRRETAIVSAPKDKQNGEPVKEELAPAPPPQKQDKTIGIEMVRAVLAEKSREGKTREVKALLMKYDTGKLSGVKQEDYAALLTEAEAL